MSYKANVYNVMIASPSDVAKERAKVVEALAEWNRHNTAERKCVFLPLRWEEDSAARMGCPPQETLNRQLWKNIGVRPHEIHIKKIKQNQKFYKRNIKYLVKAYHK